MYNAQVIKEEPHLPEVSNIKYEPIDQSDKPGQLKITNVFSVIKTEEVTDPTENFDTTRRTSVKRLTRRTTPQMPDVFAPETTTTGRRYGFRKRSGKTYEENLDDPNKCSPPPKMRKQNSPTKESKQKLKTIKKQNILSCDICSIVFFSVESLEEHVVDVHVVDKEFNCTKCDKSFINQERLDSHTAEHLKDEKTESHNKCPICSKIFISKKRFHLMRHLLTHDAVKPFKCNLCTKTFVRNIELDNHKMNQHGKAKKFECPQCSKSYTRNYMLQDHLRSHTNAKTMVCEICCAAFNTKQSLRNHKPYCKGPSSRNPTANDRTRKNTGVKLECEITGINSKRDIAEEQTYKKINFQYKKHRCSICYNNFSSMGNLKQHLTTHSGK